MNYKISELIMDHEEPHFSDELLNKERKIKIVEQGNKTRYLPLVDDANIKSIATPQGRELSLEELYDFVIGPNTTDLARTKVKDRDKVRADIAIVLGNINLKQTRERAIKAFELYKKGIVKKIIFTGGISEQRDTKGYMHPKTMKQFMDNEKLVDREWSDLSEADWGVETFIPIQFNEIDYENHSQITNTKKILAKKGINPADVLFEDRSSSTQENAEFCKNIFDIERVETGLNIKSAILVTTLWHGSRAIKQFEKVFGDSLSISFCPSTLDLEKYETLKPILTAPEFDKEAFRAELKRIYCTTPELIQKLRTETANHRNAFIEGYIDDATIETIDRDEKEEEEK